MEAFEKVWSINSDMSVYLRPDCELEPGDVERWNTFTTIYVYTFWLKKRHKFMCFFALEPGDVKMWWNQ